MRKKLNQTYLFLAFTLIILPFLGFSQSETISLKLNWDAQNELCSECYLENVSNRYKVNTARPITMRGKYNFSYTVKSISYEAVTVTDLDVKKALTSDLDLEIQFKISKAENFAVLNFNPVLLIGGESKMVKEIIFEVSGERVFTSGNREAEFASTSVLASGDWYKIGVKNDGIQKIDYNFLSELGINMGTLNPLHINIYGNHVPTLPILNSEYHPDDLLKNAIQIVGEGDGVFNTNDYILFYGKGPDVVTYSPNRIYARKNQIDSLNYYFIHVNASVPPKRISSVGNSADATTHNLSSYQSYSYHESNDVNTLGSGDIWLGENLDILLEHEVVFNIENREVADSVYVRTQMGSAIKTGTAKYNVLVDGVLVDDFFDTNISVGDYLKGRLMSSDASFKSGSSNLRFQINLVRTSADTEGWIDFIQLNYTRRLQVGTGQFIISSLESVGAGNVAQYNISNANEDLQIWEITDPTNVKKVNGSLAGSIFTFKMNADSLRLFSSFKSNQTFTPIKSGAFLGKIENQNLHALAPFDYLIVSHESLLTSAERLANIHRERGLTVNVVPIQKIYNEFSCGVSDPVAIRWFAKMFYDRAAGDVSKMLDYICLFGDGTYDPLNRISKNNYLMPTYNKTDIIGEKKYINFSSSYTADDFFALLDDEDRIDKSDLIDVAIGRIPVSTNEVANDVINKIEHYMKYGSTLFSNATGVQCDASGYASTFGDWRNRVVLMADDEDDGKFVTDCEDVSNYTNLNHPEINITKLYLDAYKQITTSGGQRYPAVEEAIDQNIERGALLFNYVGHGGETGLTQERTVDIDMIRNWTNVNNLTVFVSATCEFSRFDDPSKESAGEITLTSPYGGAVGMLTTTRLVSISFNSTIVGNLYRVIFNEVNGEPLPIGEILRQSKNLSAGGGNHIRNFSLLGDPAMKLGKPSARIHTDSINGVSIDMPIDTLKALSRVTISGHLTDYLDVPLNGFNGTVYPTVYDKSKVKQTLGQDPGSPIKDFNDRNNIIYKGKATVADGQFKFTFVVPKDIDYSFGLGKVSYYANDESSNYYGFDTSVVVGGINPDGLVDEVGPQIELFMNDENFVHGGLTNGEPLFIAHVSDENGINTTGNGIGHDITIILDGNTAEPIFLNNFYEADLDTYQSGKVLYRMTELEEGPHQITFKIWDVNNNSSEMTLDFVVMNDEEIGISHLLNYPNPFTTSTDFYFEHNQICNAMNVSIEIFTISGKLVKTIQQITRSSGFRSEGIHWDGRDDFGDKLARGVYIYELSLETCDGKRADKIEKLVIL